MTNANASTDRASGDDVTADETRFQPSTPRPGEFRMARFEDEDPRMVLVVAPVDGVEASNVWLVTTEVEYATGSDLLLDPEETGLPVPVAVETDIGFPLWNWQLDEPAGTIAAEYTHLLRPMLGADELPTERRGVELAGPWDTRHAWKDEEYRGMVRLAADLFGELAGSTEESVYEMVGTPPEHWPSRFALLPGLEVVVDILGHDAPPLIQWNPESTEVVPIAERLLAAIYGSDWAAAPRDAEHRLGTLIRHLALAEERYALTGLGYWALDSALLCAELIEAPELNGSWTLLEDLLDERVPVATETVLGAPANEAARHGLETLRSHCERRGLPLDIAGSFVEDVPGRHRREPRRAGAQPFPVSPGIPAQLVELDAGVIRLRLAGHLPPHAELWLHVFDRAAGQVAAAVEFDVDQKREEATASMPERGEEQGVIVLAERHEHVDLMLVLGEVLRAAPVEPEASARFAEAAQRELGGAKAIELLTAITAALTPKRHGSVGPHFTSGADATPGARLLARANEEAIAAADLAPEPQPDPLSPVQWKALLAKFGDWLGGPLTVRPALRLSLQAASASTLHPRTFGRGLAVVPIDERLVALKVSARSLGEVADGPLLVVLQNERGDILASHAFDRVTGTETVELAVESAAAATADDVVMIIARRPADDRGREP